MADSLFSTEECSPRQHKGAIIGAAQHCICTPIYGNIGLSSSATHSLVAPFHSKAHELLTM